MKRCFSALLSAVLLLSLLPTAVLANENGTEPVDESQLELGMRYHVENDADDVYSNWFELFAGTYRVDLALCGSDHKAVRQLTGTDVPAFAGVVSGAYDAEADCWTVTVAEPEENGSAEGTIRYGSGDNNTIRVRYIPSHGAAVSDSDRVAANDYPATGEGKNAAVVPFTWDGAEYYFGVAEMNGPWSDPEIVPVGNCGREMQGDRSASVLSAQVFDKKDGSCTVNSDIRARLVEAGCTFALELLPTENCQYDPVDQGVDEAYKDDWKGYLFTRQTLGLWIVKAALRDGNGNVICEQYCRLDYNDGGGRPHPQTGTLILQYNGRNFFAGDETDAPRFAKGVYEAALMLATNDGWPLIGESDAGRLRWDGTIITGLMPFSRADDQGNTITLWRITVAEPEDGTTEGWIAYGEGADESRIAIGVVSTRVEDGDRVETIDYEKLPLAQKFTWRGGEYYLGVSSLWQDDEGWQEELIAPAWECCLDEGEDMGCLLSAQVFTLTGGDDQDVRSYEPVSEEVLAEMEKEYDFSLALRPTANCTYYPLVERDEYTGRTHCRFAAENFGDWDLLAKAEPKNGGGAISQRVGLRLTGAALLLRCDRMPFAAEQTVASGTVRYAELRFGNRWLSGEDGEKLTCDGEVVKEIAYSGDLFWTLTIDPDGGEGWIAYEGRSYVRLHCVPLHGDRIADNDPARVGLNTEQYDAISRNVVTPIVWHGETYYLAAAEYNSDLGKVIPYGRCSRGVIEEDGSYHDMFFGARVFQLISGRPNSDNASYQLRDDVRAAMVNEGYTFELAICPTDRGCLCYPARIPVKLSSLDPRTEKMVTAEWEKHIVTEDSVGSWIYEARMTAPNNGKVTVNRSAAAYEATHYTYVPLSSLNVDTINREIASAISAGEKKLESPELSRLVEEELYLEFIVLQLPEGEIEGQLRIPQSPCGVMLRGARHSQENGIPVIATTIRGGIENDNSTCNLESLHFIGGGRETEYLAGRVPNYAVYGRGQGIYNGCIFEDYFCALHSEEKGWPAWGGWCSVFRNNNIALHLDTTMGGNLGMDNNWFVGNGTAIQIDRAPGAYVLETSRIRFVNNGRDVVNNSGKVLWLSQNFFYHGDWEPVLWEDISEERDGSVLRLNYSDDDGLIRARNNAPEFRNRGNYNSVDRGGQPKYAAFLPWFDGWSQTQAYPLARTQDCDTFFYPNRNGGYCPPWWHDRKWYPSNVLRGKTIGEDELDGLRFSSYDGDTGESEGTFYFNVDEDN